MAAAHPKLSNTHGRLQWEQSKPSISEVEKNIFSKLLLTFYFQLCSNIRKKFRPEKFGKCFLLGQLLWPCLLLVKENNDGIFVQFKYLNCLLRLLLISNYMQGQAALTPCSLIRCFHGYATETLMLLPTQVWHKCEKGIV